jgi:hypothetical protein
MTQPAAEDVDLVLSGPPVQLKYCDRVGLRTIWKKVLLRYLEGSLGDSMRANNSAIGPWATYRNHPYDYATVTKLKRKFGRFGWEFKSDHRCPFCGRGRTHKLPGVARVSQNEHSEECRWRGMRWDQLWVTFRRVGATPEMIEAGMEYLNRKSRRRPLGSEVDYGE